MRMALNLIFPPSSTTILTPNRHKYHIHSSISSFKSNPDFSFNQLYLKKSPKTLSISRDYPPKKPFNFICRDGMDENPLEDEDTLVLDFSDSTFGMDENPLEDEDTLVLDYSDSSFGDLSSPWEGAIIYKRYPSVSHLEYCTTLERLGMEHVSTEVSKSKASIMGLRVTKAVKDYPLGTPVQISIDVTNKKHKVRLDGLIKTVLSLRCLRCGEPAAKSLFLDLAILLDEQPVEESDVIDMGDIFGKNKSKASRFDAEEDYDDDEDIEPDFHLYFPSEEKEIDISKLIRDMVHVEINLDALCDSGCKGVCTGCGADLNTSRCICSELEEEVEEKIHGPLRDLKTRIQMKK